MGSLPRHVVENTATIEASVWNRSWESRQQERVSIYGSWSRTESCRFAFRTKVIHTWNRRETAAKSRAAVELSASTNTPRYRHHFCSSHSSTNEATGNQSFTTSLKLSVTVQCQGESSATWNPSFSRVTRNGRRMSFSRLTGASGRRKQSLSALTSCLLFQRRPSLRSQSLVICGQVA